MCQKEEREKLCKRTNNGKKESGKWQKTGIDLLQHPTEIEALYNSVKM